MKRRDFIVNSALCVWAAALFSGCNKKDIKKSDKQVIRRRLQKGC